MIIKIRYMSTQKRDYHFNSSLLPSFDPIMEKTCIVKYSTQDLNDSRLQRRLCSSRNDTGKI